jgi:hypothetical protein
MPEKEEIMKPRFYVMFVQHNKEADAENRTVPSAFDTKKEAEQKWHEQLGKDMKNATLDWGVGYILDNFGNRIDSKYWSDIQEEPEPVVSA